MKTSKIFVYGFFAVMLAVAFTACPSDGGNGGKPAHTHSYAAMWSKNATQHWHECSCGDKADVARHTAGDWIVDQAATATTAGSRHKECTVCEYTTATGTIPATGEGHTHSYAAAWSKNATQHWHECSCGDKADVARHTAGDWIVDQDATATTAGSRHKECTVCEYKTATGTIPATGAGHIHDYSAAWSKNATQHWHECSCGDKTDVANHTGDPCTVCGYASGNTAVTCTVTFNSNGGSAVSPITATSGTTITKPTDPTKANSIFDGWYKEAGLANAWNFATDTVTQNITLYAKWSQITADTKTVTFNSGGGSAVPFQYVNIGGKATEPQGVTRTNYAIDGWYTNDSLTNQWDFANDTVSADMTLYAKWTRTYTVTFASNGGSSVSAQIIRTGEKAVEPQNVTREFHTLAGWYRDNTTFQNQWNFAANTISQDITLYAKWTCTVTFSANGGTGTVPTAQTANTGASITLPNGSGLSKSGYIFGGWNTNESGTGTNYNAGDSYTVTGSITLYAKWTCTITFSANGGTGTVPTAQTATAGSSITLPNGSGLTRTNYTFGGWNTNATGMGTTYSVGSSYAVTGNVTLYAKWEGLPCTITFNANGGTGTVPTAQTATAGASITLPGGGGLSRTGYTFGGWNTNATGTGTNYSVGPSYTVTGSITLYARWYIPVEMVEVPSGSFQMGDDANIYSSPVHTVTLTGFYMGKYEVTQKQYEAVMGRTIQEQDISGWGLYGVGDNYPMYYVSWYEALVFCNRLSLAEGLTPAYRINNSTNPSAWGTVPFNSSNATWDAVTIVSGSTGYRLPTEAQWEYAAKGGNGSPGNYTYAGSNNVEDVAWYRGNNGAKGSDTYGAKAVGTKAPNGLGIYDMSGNVMEWCWDWYDSYRNVPQTTDPTSTSSGSDGRIWRGGDWSNPAESVTDRRRHDPYVWGSSVGFRLARPAQ